MYDRISRVEHVDHARRSAQHCIKSLLSAQTQKYVTFFFLLNIFYLSVNLRHDLVYNLLNVFNAATTIFLIFTLEFLSMKGAQGKYGGSFLVTMVRIFTCMHPVTGFYQLYMYSFSWH